MCVTDQNLGSAWIYVCWFFMQRTNKMGDMKATSLAVWLHNRKLGEGLGTRLMLDQIAEVIEEAGH